MKTGYEGMTGQPIAEARKLEHYHPHVLEV